MSADPNAPTDGSLEGPTVLDVPSAPAIRSRSGASTGGTSFGSLLSSGDTIAGSPAEAMRLEEVARFHTLNRTMRWLSLGLLALLPMFEYGGWLRWLLVGGLAAGVPMGLWFDRIIAKPNGLTSARMTTVAVGMGINAFVGILYFGVFSGATALVVLGLFVLSRTEYRSAALFVYVTSASLQALFAGLVIGDVMVDPGLIQVVDPSTRDQILMQFVIQAVYLFAYLIGSASRKTTLEAISRLQSAREQLLQRDAWLNEARHDLDRALAAGGLGRYSEHTVGSYRLGGVIGRGAMAEVYEGVHVETGEPAAVKLLHESVLAQPRAVARFLREARAAAAVKSPNVARILEASDPMDPLPYLAMERLHGCDLSQLLREHPSLPLADVVELVRQVADVVDQARDAGVVHRDLKPQNLFFAELRSGKKMWKVLDFGVSVLAEGSGTLTQGHVVGTPAYISPEQARGEEVDHRADIHALAAIAYRCITGRPPFVGKDVPSLLYAAVHTMPERASDLAEVPTDVDAVLAIGLAKRRDKRFESAAELAQCLSAAAAGKLNARVRTRASNVLALRPWGSTERMSPRA